MRRSSSRRAVKGENMKNLKHHIFGKKDENGRKRYWLSVRTRKERESEDYVDATILCNLSKTSEEKFGQYARPTKSPDVMMIRAELTDWWFKAVELKDGPKAIVFVNDFEIVPDKSNKSSW